MANLQTINLGGLTLNSAINTGIKSNVAPWLDTTSFDIAINGFKKYQVIEAKEDLLALSVSRKRSDPGCLKYHTLLDDSLQNSITDDDRTQAAKIRDYYQKKFLLWELKGTKLTAYRTELKDFVFADGSRFKEHMVQIAWRLPDFYEYDTEFEELHRQHNQTIKAPDASTRDLTLVKTFDVKKKHTKKREFWFSDEFNNLVHIAIPLPNPLVDLLDHVAKSVITVNCNYVKCERDGKEYLKANALKFI